MGWSTILALGAALPLLLKGGVLPIRAYTTADGLAADNVGAIFADSRGFLWFATPEGLSRFDGYHFVNYGVADGLPHNVVSALIETRSGEHFVGTARGIARINSSGKGARFVTYAPEREPARNFVIALRESRSGAIWCATWWALFEWNGGGSFRRWELPLAGARIGDIVEDAHGNIWIGTNRGIYVLGADGVRQRFTTRDGLPGDWVEALLLDSKAQVWAAVRGGIALIRPTPAGVWRVAKAYTDRSGLIGNDAKALAEASDGTLWIGTSVGISRLRLGADDQPTFENLTRADGLSDRQITVLAEDQAGNMWAGTEGAGVMRIDRTGFTTYREPDGLAADRVWSVFEDQSGELVAVAQVFNAKRAVNIFDGRRFHAVVPNAANSWGWNQVLLQSRAGDWWAATKQGLCRFRAGKAAGLDGRSPLTCYAPDTTIFRIFEDSRGGIWASAQSHPEPSGDQLMRWDPRTNTIVNFPAPRVAGAAADDLVYAFAEDAHGNIWMGRGIGGLYRYDGHGFQYFQRADGVPGGPILALLADAGGLWIGSGGGGLGRLTNAGDPRPRIEIYSTARGLASNTIECLVEDRQGRLYAGTGKGVDRLDPRTGHIRHFSSADGLAHGVFRGAVRDRSGSLWFATTQGLSRLIPVPDRPPVKPHVFITDLRIGGAAWPLSQLGEQRLASLRLRPSQNELQVEFVGLDYEPGDIVRYSYKLEGIDREWSPPRSQQSVNYAALAGGRYRFLVKAVTADGEESAAPAEIEFTVLPPVWQRWWFQGLGLALAAAAVLAAHRYRVAQLVKIERIRTAIATDLHDDIGASLSQIAILSEVARVGGNGEARPGEVLERVATLARELIDSMSDIVWSIRPAPDGLDSLIRHMREFGLDLLAPQGIKFELRTPRPAEDVQFGLQARRQLFLMFKECIHNAARHSRCTEVCAELAVEDREVVLMVKDNGAGLSNGENPAGKMPGGNGGSGIPGMRRRAESLGGSLRLDSQPGEGCTVTIHLPTRRGPFSKPRL